MKIELVCLDEKLEQAIEIILHAAKSGEIGDGKIFISTVEDAIRIRTGESGESAIQPV